MCWPAPTGVRACSTTTSSLPAASRESVEPVHAVTPRLACVVPLPHLLLVYDSESTKFVDVGHRGCGANRAVSKSGKKTVVSTPFSLSLSPPSPSRGVCRPRPAAARMAMHLTCGVGDVGDVGGWGGGMICAGENTLLSFVRAGQLGRGAVEFDVQLSKDGVPVVCAPFPLPIVFHV